MTFSREGNVYMAQQVPNYSPLSRTNFALLVIRMVAGLIFFMHGYEKFFDHGLAATRDGFSAMGVPLPAVTSFLAATFEFFGGILLFAGVYTRIVAILLGIEMIAAMLLVHVEHGFFVANNGVELVLMLAAVCAGLVVAGAGHYSLDETFHLPFSGDLGSLFRGERR